MTQPGLKLSDELGDQVFDAICGVLAERMNKGVAGDHEPIGRALLIQSPELMRLAHALTDAATAALRLDDPETLRRAFQAATDDLMGRHDPTGEDYRTKPLITNPDTACDAAARAVRAFWASLSEGGAEPEEADGG